MGIGTLKKKKFASEYENSALKYNDLYLNKAPMVLFQNLARADFFCRGRTAASIALVNACWTPSPVSADVSTYAYAPSWRESCCY